MPKELYVGVKGVICRQGRALILKRLKPQASYWDLPGGRVDGQETLEQALTRELKEELPSIGRFEIGPCLKAWRLSEDLPDGRGLVLIFYKVEAAPFEVRLSDEHVDYRWLDFESLGKLLHDPVKIGEGSYQAISLALAKTPL